jgi:peptidoglycan/LPS O-acetylase OafA/YrhL
MRTCPHPRKGPSEVNQTISAPIAEKRQLELDSIRGLAAIRVVLTHLLNILRTHTIARDGFQWTFYEYVGHNAVILFFVLSGFVLSIPAVQSKPQPYSVFLIRRVFRIYFPYIVAIAFAVLLNALTFSSQTRKPFLDACCPRQLNWHDVSQYVVFIGKLDAFQFDPPVWSLVHEMRISIIFPFLCLLVLKLKPVPSLILSALVSTTCQYLAKLTVIPAFGIELIDSINYAMVFVVGINLYLRKQEISNLVKMLTPSLQLTMTIVFLWIYLLASDLWSIAMRALTGRGMFFIGDWFSTLGAVGLIALGSSSPPMKRVLLWGPLKKLGAMSYSVYLLHFIVIRGLGYFLYPQTPLLVLLLICLAVTLVLLGDSTSGLRFHLSMRVAVSVNM